MKNADILLFQKVVLAHYRKDGRHDLPWRKTKDPYRILVSEVMLQQTQVDRVISKYAAFLKAFPTVKALAKASNTDVLKLWSGLGYNRRALYLKRAGEAVVAQYKGVFPRNVEALLRLPGIGPYTARAVATFSHDMPLVFIETNIRRVFIHHFFPKAKAVPDRKLMPLIEAALPKKGSPREWYSALMDYGSHLKGTIKNPNRRSAHYSKQSKFEGSVREARGAFLRALTSGPVSKKVLLASYKKEDKERMKKALAALVKDGMVTLDKKGNVKIA